MASFKGLIERAEETYHVGVQSQDAAYEQPHSQSKPGGFSGLIERAKDNSVKTLSDRYNRLAWDKNTFVSAVERETGPRQFNAADFFEERKRQAEELKSRAAAISLLLDDHADSYTQESYDFIKQYLSTFDTEVDDVLGRYQPSLDSRAGMRAYEDELLAAMERNEQLRKLDRMVDYAFEPGSPSSSFMQSFRKYQNDESYRGVSENWTDADRFELGLLQLEDPAKARDYAIQLNNYYNAKATEQKRQQIRDDAPSDIWGNTGRSILAGMVGSGEIFDRAAENAARGRTTEKGYLTATDYANETSGAISEHLNNRYGTVDTRGFQELRDIGQAGLRGSGVDPSYVSGAGNSLLDLAADMVDQKGIGDVYNFGYSLAQNLASRYTLGMVGGQPLVLANYFANAATSAIDDARRRGATGSQAMGIGLIKGALEVGTEFIPTSELFKMGPAVTIKDFLKAIGVEALEEFVGEGANALGGYIADKKIMGDLSEFETAKRKYMEEYGMTEEQAHTNAIKDAVANIAFEGLSGALSGAISGGTESAVRTGLANQYYRNVNPESLIKAGLDSNADSDAYRMAQQMQEQTENGQKPSASQKRVLAYNVTLQRMAEEKVAAEMAEPSVANMTAEQVEEMKPTTTTDGNARLMSGNRSVDVQEFAEVKDGKAKVKLADGSTADYQDISFGTEKQGNQFFAVESLPVIDTAHANELLNTIRAADVGNDTAEVVAIRESYRLGYMGATTQELRGSDAGILPTKVQDQIYNIGKQQRTTNDAIRAQAKAVTAKPSGDYKKVIIEGKLSNLRGDAAKKRKAEIAYVDRIADTFAGTNVHVYESYKKNGKMYYKDNSGVERLAPNGRYVNDEIWVDINSGDNGEGMMLNTFAHEMYHHIEKWNKPKARELAEFVVKELGLESVDKAVAAQIEKARAAGYGEEHFADMTPEQARNEVYMRAMSDFVADSLETMFTRGDPAKAIANLKKENKTLFNQIKAFIDEWISKVKKFYSDKTISQEGAMVAQLEKFEQLQQLFMEAMAGAGENYNAALEALTPGEAGIMVNENGDPVAMSTEDGSVMLSIRTYEEDGRNAFRDYLDKCVTSNRLTEVEAKEMRDGIEDIYNVCKEFKDKYAPFSAWSDAEVIRDTRGRPVFSVVTPNGDYKMNLDFSLVCKKRRTLDAVFNEMSRRGIIDDFELGQKSVVKINEIIRKHDLETACALCFVDAKRFRQANMADSFTRLYNELVESLVPEAQNGSIDHFNFSGYETIKKVEGGIDTWDNEKLDFSHLDKVMKEYGKGTVEYKAARYIKNNPQGRKLLLRGDFMSSQGFDAVKIQNRDILKLYNSKKGTGGPKAAFGDVQYLNEIIKKSRTWTPAKAYAVGGVRIQSFSDYVPRMVFDYTQMIYDLAATKLPAHAYTKESLFVKQFGLTGVKINMSLIPAVAKGGIAPGLDAKGNYVWAGESFNYDEAVEIQNAEGYTENCGTICVGVSKKHIEKLLRDPNIRMVIPYHKSGLNPIVAHMNKIAEFTDYTNDQRTKDKDGKALSKEFDFNKALHNLGANADPKAVASEYLKWCEDNGYTPKFAEFAGEENYYKLLEDFTLYDKDGKYVPQREVRAVFPKDGNAFGSMKDLIKSGLQEDAIVEGKRDKNLSSIVDEIQRTLPKTEAEISEEQVKQADRDLEANEMYSLRGVNKDGIEVYETSDEVKNLTKKERQQRFLDIMANEFRGRTAKFVRNGHAYYATFDEKDVNKNVYGDKRSDKKGYRAKINVGADGDIFELVENSKYDGSKPEKGKKIAAHQGVGYWDYFIKTVQIDNVVFDLNANVRKKADGAFVYSIQLNENKKIKASPPLGLLLKASNGVTNAFRDMVSQPDGTVNTEMNSLRNQKATAREILTQIDTSTRNKHEANLLGQYQENIAKLAELEPRLTELNNQIAELSQDKKRVKELLAVQKEQRQVKASVNRLNRLVNAFERSDMGKRLVTEVRAKARQQQDRETLKAYKEEQKKLITSMQTEQRVIREELTGKESDITIMEREFIRLAKKYEQLDTRTGKSSIKDAKTIAQLKSDLKAEAKSHKEDSNIWEREFNRLLKDYETSGRQIARLEATIARQRATAKARVEGRRKTEMRHKIQRKVNELDRLLRHGTKHRNVPEFLQDSVAAVLQAINMEVRDGEQRRKTYEQNIARYDRLIAATTDPAKVAELLEKRDNYVAKGDQFANRMATLQKSYEQIREENTGLELDEGIAKHLSSLFETVGDTPLGQMTAEQLDAVNDILNVTMATVRNANEMLSEARSAGVVESSKSAIMEIKSAGETKKKKTRFRKGLEQFGWNNLKPVYVFDVIGSKTLTDRYKALRKGEDILAVDLNEAKNFFQEQWKKNGGKDWDMEKKWQFTSTSGKSFELDLNQIMSLYALAKDNDARSHLRVGGFAFDSDYQTKKRGPLNIPIKVESTDASAYNLSDEILGEIISKLTPQQRAFADAMQAYLSDTMAAKGNEVSLKKYGIRLFKKKDYFPIRVADQFLAKAREQNAGDRKIKDSGFTKDRKPEAKNPVVLSGFTEVWAEHVDEMSLYHSFVLPLDDFNRVLNYHDAFVEGEQAASVVEAITNAFGKGAVNYIDQLIKDVNGGIKGGSTVSFANSLVSKAKKAQTMASLSVAIQQPSSIIRAMSEVDSKYFIGPRVTEKSHDRTWNEIKKHAPIAIIKEMGGYDTNVGKSTVDYLIDTADYDGFGEKFKALFTDEKFRDDALGRLPALMDEMSWGVIWNAVKREQRDHHPNMDTSSDAFMKLVANRFTEVITRTQVYDSVFSRSGMMRDRNDLAKVITSFMAEPTTTANMLAVSILQAKRGDISKTQLAKTAGSIVASLALNSALVSVIYALRDDDEDKRYDEKWIENFRNNFFESLNPLGYIPYVRDVYNLFVKGYDVERADLELFGDLQNAIDGLGNEDITAWEKTENVIGAIGNLLGVPVRNILRDVKGIVQTLGFAWDDRPNPKTKTGTYMAWRGMDLTDKEQMILAIRSGDEEHLQRVFGRFESQQKAESALQSAIREKYVAGEMTAEEAEEMLTTNFDRDDEYEVYWILDQWDYARENGNTEGYTKYGTFFETIENGGDYTAEMDRLMAHGAEASEIRSQISRHYRKQYLTDAAVREEIREKLQPVYEATGMYDDEIQEKFNDWDFEAEYGMTYSNFKAEYREGNVTEAEMRGAMDFYGLLNYEIEEGIRGLNEEIKFYNKYGMSISEMRDAYDNGDLSRNELINALVFTGKSRTEATEEVNERDIERKYGIDYAKLDDAYKYNDISRQEFYNAMVEHGASKQEADEAILGYDWLKKNVKKYPDLAISDAKRFVIKVSDKMEERTLADYGVSIDAYLQYKEGAKDCPGVDANGDGKIDSYSKAKQLFAMIDKLPISNEAKDGLALVTNAQSTIRKYAPWRKRK